MIQFAHILISVLQLSGIQSVKTLLTTVVLSLLLVLIALAYPEKFSWVEQLRVWHKSAREMSRGRCIKGVATSGSGERRELPQRGPGRIGRKGIFFYPTFSVRQKADLQTKILGHHWGSHPHPVAGLNPAIRPPPGKSNTGCIWALPFAAGPLVAFAKKFIMFLLWFVWSVGLCKKCG